MTNQHHERPSGAGTSRQQIFAAAAIGALLVIAIGVLGYSHLQKTKQLELTYTEINTVHTLHAELNANYQQAIAELEAMKGDNAEMNALIEAQKTELEAQRNDIVVLLQDRRQLNLARTQLDELKVQIAGYLAEINQLNAERLALTGSNEQLAVEKQELFNHLSTQVMANTQLTEARAQLVSQNEELYRSVLIGSVVKVHNVRVEGLKVRSNGKLADKRTARKVDQLNVCFTTFTNNVVQPGPEEFFVRIVSPRGETLAIENLGSGSISLVETGEDIRYTQAAETDYQNDEQDLCLRWNPDIPFQPGRYAVEIYNKGFLAGTSSFELK